MTNQLPEDEQSPVELPAEKLTTDAAVVPSKPIGKWQKTSTSGVEHTGQGPSSHSPEATD